jgi:hypothetical protein
VDLLVWRETEVGSRTLGDPGHDLEGLGLIPFGLFASGGFGFELVNSKLKLRV